jgi:hypothetical protein
MKVYLDTNYPKNLAEALQLIHNLQEPKEVDVIRSQQLDENNESDSVVFLFDRSKRGLDITTEKHFEAGYKVFAFRLSSTEKINLYRLCLVTLKLWPKFLETIASINKPFITVYNYNGNAKIKLIAKAK